MFPTDPTCSHGIKVFMRCLSCEMETLESKLKVAEMMARDHHLHPCESCAVVESELIAAEKHIEALEKNEKEVWGPAAEMRDKLTAENARLQREVLEWRGAAARLSLQVTALAAENGVLRVGTR